MLVWLWIGATVTTVGADDEDKEDDEGDEVEGSVVEVTVTVLTVFTVWVGFVLTVVADCTCGYWVVDTVLEDGTNL